MITRASRSVYAVLYYLSWFWFGLVGLGLNLGCLLLLPLPKRCFRGRTVRRVIKALFVFWGKWLHLSHVARVRWIGFDKPLRRGTVYIANHPSLIDATLLLSRLPNALCIFKPSLMRNPAIGPAAVMAEYVSGDAGIDVIRGAADSVAGGSSLLIFPEGTRTAQGEAPGPFKPGFALIAAQAEAPVQLIIVRATPEFTARGRPWWKLPTQIPARFEISLDHCWEYSAGRPASALVREVEQRVAEVLRKPMP